MIPNEKTLLDNLGKTAYMLDKTYLSCLKDNYKVLPFDENYNIEKQVSYVSNIRALRVKRCVIDKEERTIDCFKNILSLFSSSEDTIALIFKRTPDTVEMFFAVKNIGGGRNEDSKSNINLLADSIRGNFPGTEVTIIDSKKEKEDNDDITLTSQELNLDKAMAVSVLSNIPSEKSEDFICQGIEKLLNGIVPQKKEGDNIEGNYTVIFLAEAMPILEIRNILSGYEELASAIVPFAGYQFQYAEGETETNGEMKAFSRSDGISHSITKTHSINTSLSLGKKMDETTNIGLTGGYGYSWGKTDTKSKIDTDTEGTNHSISLNTSKSTTYTYKSYLVSDLLAKLEATIKRIDESRANGLWKYAAYVLSSDIKISANVANFLRSISQGDESYIETSFIQSWAHENSNGTTNFGEILKYVNHLCHPVFINIRDRTPVTPALNVSTSELANIFAFPRTAVPSLPVIECVRFGREPHSLNKLTKDLKLGCAYHMHNEEKNNLIYLSKNELTKHTFITGSTGSGKSNTIYHILEQLNHNSIPFLVIEPAIGNYKHAFSDKIEEKKVYVYGTNPDESPLLRINPFKFPEGIHILEHMDRLVEIFNVCWPMYAAMPAILKKAVEKSYEEAGWDLRKSTNRFNPELFPSFADVANNVKLILDSSEYSDENKGNYKGALITRLESLANGIYGLIFVNDELPNDHLFGNNVIVDLSRVGSMETKALIMGLLVMKLQEYRMTSGKMNSKLTHITVLEEAHNLLKRTSTEQVSESANLLGKSVEMLANAIAEMRTYGEGFIIADQSPGLMDMSVIRNTNTKIILRLPDESDRMLVGKAAGLNDDQITELTRLQCGVAAVYQNDWIQPVLCKVKDYYEDKNKETRYYFDKSESEINEFDTLEKLKEDITKYLFSAMFKESIDIKIDKLEDRIWKSSLSNRTKRQVVGYLTKRKLPENPNDIPHISGIIAEMYKPDENTIGKYIKSKTVDSEWAKQLVNGIQPSIEDFSSEYQEGIMLAIIFEISRQNKDLSELREKWAELLPIK